MNSLTRSLILALIITYLTLFPFVLTDHDIKDIFKIQDINSKDAVDAHSRADGVDEKEPTAPSSSPEINATYHCQSAMMEGKSDIYYVFSVILLTLHGICLILASCSYFFWDVSRTTRFKKTLSAS
uniref:Uncharacterized protein n=1 Tax=Romanomermis culicivorax TaxID=13658 RepID=A0A915JHE7_ROMCU